MQVFTFVTAGFEGTLVSVEAHTGHGIREMSIVGIPDAAGRDAVERVQAVVLQSGFDFPGGRILIDMASEEIRNEAASFDLPLAVAVLIASGQILVKNNDPWLILGELESSGGVKPVKGTFSAVSSALKEGVRQFMVPRENVDEALLAGAAEIVSLHQLKGVNETLTVKKSFPPPTVSIRLKHRSEPDSFPDISKMKGQAQLKRALMVAAAGGHHMLLFGPAGSGKTLGAAMLEGLLPDLTPSVSHEVSCIWSQAGKLGRRTGMILRPPFRMPHPSDAIERLIGGGDQIAPGEISLAHGGVLLLDETPHFQGTFLQSLTEAMENGRVTVSGSGHSCWYPSRFQLLVTAKPCPCGKLGDAREVCVCPLGEIIRYWKKGFGTFMDRIDIRIPVEPLYSDIQSTGTAESSADLRERISDAMDRQSRRYSGMNFSKNRDIPTGLLREYCPLDQDLKGYFSRITRQLGLSSRACHSILRVARTIADLRDREVILQEDIEEACQYRRYGDGDFFWNQI